VEMAGGGRIKAEDAGEGDGAAGTRGKAVMQMRGDGEGGSVDT
jgi:hypothetical protein